MIDPPERESKEAYALSINVSEVIWTIVCFFALLFVLKKFLFDPLIRFMEQRQAAIDQGLERGRDAQRKKDENDAALREKWRERSVEVKQLLAEGKRPMIGSVPGCWRAHRKRQTKHCRKQISALSRNADRCAQMPRSSCRSWFLSWRSSF